MSERAIEVQGLREFRRELRRAGAQFPRELGEVNYQAAKLVAEEQHRRAPHGPHLGGGRVQPLHRAARPLRQQRAAVVSFGGVSFPHALGTEFGGSIPRFHSESRTQIRKQPSLYPAIAAKSDEVYDMYGEAIDRLARRAFPMGVS